MNLANRVLKELRSYRFFIKTLLITFAVLIGQMLAWFVILPLDYTYFPSSFFIVRWMPISIVLYLFYVCKKTWNTPMTQSQGGKEE